MRVEDVMTTAVVSVPATASLHDAAGRMLDAGVGSVVVTSDGDPAGILTEHDFVAAGHEHDDRSFTEVPVYAAASRPLETVGPTATVDRAAHKLREAAVSHLPVADGLDLVGIVTTTDLVGVRDELDEDAERALRERADWTTTTTGGGGGTD